MSPAFRCPAIVVAILVATAAPAPAAQEAQDEICREAAVRYREQFGKALETENPPVVAMYRHTFCPFRLTVKRGTKIRFVNIDRRTSHSFWFRDAGQPESERIFGGDALDFTANLPPGTHTFLCGPHWEQEKMVGTLVVEP